VTVEIPVKMVEWDFPNLRGKILLHRKGCWRQKSGPPKFRWSYRMVTNTPSPMPANPPATAVSHLCLLKKSSKYQALTAPSTPKMMDGAASLAVEIATGPNTAAIVIRC